MSEDKLSKNELEYIMNASYDSLMIDRQRAIDEFIVFEEGDEVVEIMPFTGERSKFIDKMIKYFESTEEFEKCSELIKLREFIIKAGD